MVVRGTQEWSTYGRLHGTCSMRCSFLTKNKSLFRPFHSRSLSFSQSAFSWRKTFRPVGIDAPTASSYSAPIQGEDNVVLSLGTNRCSHLRSLLSVVISTHTCAFVWAAAVIWPLCTEVSTSSSHIYYYCRVEYDKPIYQMCSFTTTTFLSYLYIQGISSR